MAKRVHSLILILALHVIFVNCGILDFLSLEEDDDAPAAEKRDRESDCLCQNSSPDGSNCICCLDYNISETFDLGPACVRIKYLSQTEGVAMNLTIGKTLSKNSIIKVDKPNEVCHSVIGGLAKMCAKFTNFAPSANGGLIGCLKMQPKLFGEVPLEFDFPCFDLNSQEIRTIEAPKKAEDEEDKEESEESVTGSTETETIGGFKVEDILNVVSKTADQGIKIIGELFGLGGDEKPETTATPAESKTADDATKKP